MLVGCILLNLTSRRQVDRVLPGLFLHYPDPGKMHHAGPELEEMLRPLGLQNRRAATLREFSIQWIMAEPWGLTEQLLAQMKGIGPYALDSYRIFVLGDGSRCDSGDKELVRWLEGRA